MIIIDAVFRVFSVVVVRTVSLSGTATVQFDKVGSKWLIAQYAKLEPA